MVLYLRRFAFGNIGLRGSGVCCDGLSAASRYFFLRSSCTLWTPRRMTSAFDTLSSSIHSSSFSAVALSRRTLREMSFGLSVGRPIFLFPNTITSLFGVANIITYRRRKVERILRSCRGRRGRRPLRGLNHWPIPLERKGGAWYNIYVVLPLAISACGEAVRFLIGVRRFPSFFIKVVIHFSDTTPDYFRSGNLHLLTAYFQFLYGLFVKAYFDVNVFWTVCRTPYFFSGHRTPPFAVAKSFYLMRPQKSIGGDIIL